MEKHPLNIHTAIAEQHASLIQYPSAVASPQPRRLLLLHGAGVAGETTWTYVTNYLTEWDEILIPDLAEMGGSRFLLSGAPGKEDYAQQVEELLDALDWQAFDVAGYSFGGMVAVELFSRGRAGGLCYLLEPAMLVSADASDVALKARDYLSVAERVLRDPAGEQAYYDFLDSVSPQRVRNEKVDALTISRLRSNARGFAFALQAVATSLSADPQYYTRWQAPWRGMSFVGELSAVGMYQRHQQLAEQSADWSVRLIPGADHSLVFTRPRMIAAAMNELKQSDLQASL